jgi:hypothetical protein
MTKLIFLIVIFNIWPFIYYVQAEDGDVTTHVECSIDDEGKYVSRVISQRSSITSFSLLSGSSIIAEGFSCPYFSIGSFYRTGLLRFFENPLGFLPSSTVFREKTGFRLNTALSGHTRFTLAGHIIPDTLSAFMSQKADRLEQAGLIAGGQIMPWVKADILILARDQAPPDYPDDWYFDRPFHPGGRVYHAGSRISIHVPPFEVFILGGMSVGAEMMPGAFLVTMGYLKVSGFRLSCLLGYQSPEYVTLSIRYPGAKNLCALSAEMRLSKLITVDIKLGYQWGLSGFNGTFPTMDLAYGGTTLAFLVLTGKPLSIWLKAAISGKLQPDAEWESTLCAEARVMSRHQVKIKYHGRYITGMFTHDAELEYSMVFRTIHVSAGSAYSFLSRSFSLKGALEITAGVYCFKVYGEKADACAQAWREGLSCTCNL